MDQNDSGVLKCAMIADKVTDFFFALPFKPKSSEMGLDVLRKFKLHHHINTSTVTDLFYFFLKMKKCPLDNFFFFFVGQGVRHALSFKSKNRYNF